MAYSQYNKKVKPKLTLIESWARTGLTDEQIAKNLGISKTTFYKYQKEHSELSELLKNGKDIIDTQVENALIKRIMGFEYTEITKERIVDTRQKKRHGGSTEFTESEWELAISFFGGKCCYCGDTAKLTKDHIVPLDQGGTLTIDNVVPCCQSCNSSKKDHDMVSWFKKQSFYSNNKLNKIYDYLEFANQYYSKKQDGQLVVTKEVKKFIPPDPTSIIFWLKNRKPVMWGNRSNCNLAIESSNSDIDGAKNTMIRTIELLSQGEIDNNTANTLIACCNAVLSAIRTDDQQKKINELEQLLKDMTDRR